MQCLARDQDPSSWTTYCVVAPSLILLTVVTMALAIRTVSIQKMPASDVYVSDHVQFYTIHNDRYVPKKLVHCHSLTCIAIAIISTVWMAVLFTPQKCCKELQNPCPDKMFFVTTLYSLIPQAYIYCTTYL